MWTLFWMPLRRASFWWLALGGVVLGYSASWSAPLLTPLGEASGEELLHNWAFVSRAVLGGWLVAYWAETRAWLRARNDSSIISIAILSTLFLPSIYSFSFAAPSASSFYPWAFAVYWILPLRLLRCSPTLSGWGFALLASLYAVGEGTAELWTPLCLAPILVHLGLICGRSRHARHAP